MKYLLDTQVYLWILENNLRIKPITNILQNSQNSFFLSSESLKEIVIKYRINKLELKNDTLREVLDLIPKLFNLKKLSVSVKHLIYFASLKNTIHKDPMDLLIISQAIENNLTLISSDENFPYYAKQYGLKLLSI